jgi:hypothetical protein
MLRSFSTRSLLLVPALLGLALVAAAGCSDGAEEPEQGPAQVEGKGDLNSSSQAVSLANLQMVNGTYGAGCTSRSGPWSLSLAGYGGALDNPLLSVVTNDAACTLTVTGIKASGTLFSATPVIPLGTNFAGSASLFQSPAVPGGYTSSTLAGSSLGYADGTGAGAQFKYPHSVEVDSSGNLFVADTDNQRIREVTPAGVVTTLAGSGVQGTADGNGTSAQFRFPKGLASNPSGEIFIADTDNHRIRKLAPFGGTPAELFYGNAKVNTSTFASSFVVNLLLSDDPGTASGSNNAVFASVSGSSQTDLVPPPNYTLSTAGITVQADVNGLVTSVAGNLALTDGSNTGSGYVINLGTLPATPTFTEYDTAYNAGSAVAISGANPAVPASSMLAAGVQLPATRTVIVRRSDNGVIAYQAIKITFNAPTP